MLGQKVTSISSNKGIAAQSVGMASAPMASRVCALRAFLYAAVQELAGGALRESSFFKYRSSISS